MKQPTQPRCVVCRTRLTRNKNGPPGGFRRDGVLFCSLNCVSARVNGHQNRGTYLQQARLFRKEACEACGSTEALTVHHCDADWKHNDPENLQTLCSPCHSFWHEAHRRTNRQVSGKMPWLFRKESR